MRYFSPFEFNYYSRMDGMFLHQLDLIRHVVGSPMKVTHDFAHSGHSSKSYHYKGRAVDGIPLHIDYLEYAERIYKASKKLNIIIGLGVYPFWNTKGFHLDNGNRKGRNLSTFWYRDENNKYHNDYNFYNILKSVKHLNG